jgi:nitroreductase
MQKPAITQVEIDQTIANRWSGRAYDPTRHVNKNQIIALLEAARWAPSCFGDQPWRFIVWDKSVDANAWQTAFDTLAEGNQAWVKNAQVILLVCADTLFGHNQKPNRWAQYDTGAAAENLCLEATHQGFMAHQMGGFLAEKIQAAFHVPAQFTPMAMISIGYQAEIASLAGEELARETAARSRKSLGELFYHGTWGQPAV